MLDVLRFENVTRLHGQGAATVHALNGVDLQVARGEFVAVMGPSGSGKSTLLNLAGGLDRATSGSVLVDGLDLGDLNAKDLAALRRRKVGYVFQDFNLIPTLSAVENVALPLELDGQKPRAAQDAALASLELVGLADLADRLPQDMSGGQQQRVAIARAVVSERALILADEPTGALDSAAGELVMRLIRERCSTGVGALMATHDAGHAAWADRVVFLRDGTVLDDTGPGCDAESLLDEV